MHGHRVKSCMSTSLHPHVMCVWGDIPMGLVTRVRTFKPPREAFQACGESTDHFHHINHSGIAVLASWLLTTPRPLINSWSSWAWIACIIQCPQLMIAGSGMLLKSTVMTQMVRSRIPLWSWTRFGLGFRPDPILISGHVQLPLVSHIPLLFILHFLRSRCIYNRLCGLHKLHFFGDFDWWATPSGISQPGLVWEILLIWNDLI